MLPQEFTPNVEPLETFGLTLTQPVGADLATATATATIVDASATAVATPNFFSLVGAATQTAENARWVDIPVELAGPSTDVLRVAYTTRAITASAGSDFIASTGTLVFEPGDVAKTVRVLLANDGAFEPSETFAVDFSAPGGAVAAPALLPTSVTVTLSDDEVSRYGNQLANRLVGTTAVDHIFGLGGNDRINGLGGSDLIVGGVGLDKLYGDGGNDALIGGPGADLLQGGPGVDVMDGGAGNDTYVVENPRDRVVEGVGQGTDTVVSSVSHTLAANVENGTLIGTAVTSLSGNTLANVLTGSAVTNGLAGGAGNDTLAGGAGNDLLLGGTGLDRLAGGFGRDLMTGGGGGDVFLYRSVAESTPGRRTGT